jgi:carbon-monoxide dehydrogenase medium subunit
MAAEECEPTADQRGPADYKRALAGELVKRALRTAIARCRGQEG